MKEQIKELRVQIDGLAQLTKILNPIKSPCIKENCENPDCKPKNSREIEKAVDSLYLAKAWLGKVLGELGNENPYGSGYKTKEDIVPTQDVANSIESKGDLIIPNKKEPLIGKHWSDLNHIEKVDWLRTEITKNVNAILQYTNQEGWIGIYSLRSEQNLSEARFWLGFECARIKEEK